VRTESGPRGRHSPTVPIDPTEPTASTASTTATEATQSSKPRDSSERSASSAPTAPAVTPRPTARRPFLVPVAALRKRSGGTRHEVRQGVIDGLGAVAVAVPAGSPVVADLTLSSYPGGVMAVGVVSAPWIGECRRCGGPVEGTVAAAVREHYAPTEAARQDEDAYPLDGDELDLEPLARDAVLLDLPLAPLCSEGCLGLCPQCGANRNLVVCACVTSGDPRWSALDGLRRRDPGDGDLA